MHHFIPRLISAWWAPVVLCLVLEGAALVTATPIDDAAILMALPLFGMMQGPPDPDALIRAMPESCYRVLQEIPELDARPGDRIWVRPNDPDPLRRCILERALPLDRAVTHIGGVEAPLVYAAPPNPSPAPFSFPEASPPGASGQEAAGGTRGPLRLLR